MEPLPLRIRVRLQRLFEQRREIHEMRGEAEIFLRDLHFEHQRRFRHGAEQRMERLARLEVDRSVLHLQQHVVAKLPIERHELGVRLLRAVIGLLVRVHERAPHHHATVRRQRIGQHVRAVRVGAAVVLRTRLPFRVRLDEEAAEVRNLAIDLIHLRAPPGLHAGVERICGLQSTDLDGRAEARGQKHAHAVGPQHVRRLPPPSRDTRAASTMAFAFTLVSTVPLMPSEAHARA